MSEWEPTMNLRWNHRNMSSPPHMPQIIRVLQQEWIKVDRITTNVLGQSTLYESEWRDVPEVSE